MQASHTRTSPLPGTIWRSRKDKKTNPRLLFDRSPPPTQNQKKKSRKLPHISASNALAAQAKL
jgi:hypothetical protein